MEVVGRFIRCHLLVLWTLLTVADLSYLSFSFGMPVGLPHMLVLECKGSCLSGKIGILQMVFAYVFVGV